MLINYQNLQNLQFIITQTDNLQNQNNQEIKEFRVLKQGSNQIIYYNPKKALICYLGKNYLMDNNDKKEVKYSTGYQNEELLKNLKLDTEKISISEITPNETYSFEENRSSIKIQAVLEIKKPFLISLKIFNNQGENIINILQEPIEINGFYLCQKYIFTENFPNRRSQIKREFRNYKINQNLENNIWEKFLNDQNFRENYYQQF